MVLTFRMAGPRDLFHLVGATALGRYHIEEVVGENAYAVVYRGSRLDVGVSVAIKVFKVLGDFSAEERGAVLDMLALGNADVAKVARQTEVICPAYDVGKLTLRTGNWVPCMAFEWLDGASLRQIRDEEQQYGLPPRTLVQTMSLLEPVATALTTAHQVGIVHSGLTPSSVLVLGDPRSPTVRLRLIDFGVARALSTARAGQRGPGSFTLTPAFYKTEFAAPEQVDFTGHSIGTATDVYSFALVLTYLLGYPPQDPAAAREPSYYRGTPGARGVVVPEAVERVFARALERDPQKRPATIGEFWNELRSARGLAPLTGMSEEREETVDDYAPTLRVQPLSEAESERLVALPSAGTNEADRTQQRAPVSLAKPGRSNRLLGLLLGAGVVAGAAFVAHRYRDALLQRIHDFRNPPVPVASTAPTQSATVSASASAAPPPSPCPKGMVLIPGGELRMGRKDDRAAPGGAPQMHEVKLSPFCMDVHEVTVAEYKKCSDDGLCKRAAKNNEWPRIRPDERINYDPECNIQHADARKRHPVNCVTWEMADLYCKAQQKRLPTEAEWERAARGSDSRPYPWGREDPDTKRLNACGSECVSWHKQHRLHARQLLDGDDGFTTTAPVGSFPRGASPYGVQDMAGNVWEWVGDWFAPYPEEGQVEPTGPTTGQHRVLRGGAFQGTDSAVVRATNRHHDLPMVTSWIIGFRCARDPSD